MLRRSGFREPALQHEVRSGGRLVAVVDFAYPELRLAIEADGYRWHSGRARWQHDRRRSNELTLLGWRIIHVTWDELSGRREALIDSIRNAMAAPSEARSRGTLPSPPGTTRFRKSSTATGSDPVRRHGGVRPRSPP
jgi:hypothetical protein